MILFSLIGDILYLCFRKLITAGSEKPDSEESRKRILLERMKNLLRLRVKALVLTAIFLIGIAGMLSAQKIAIIDAGSSGSRLYVYELDMTNKHLSVLYDGRESGEALSEIVKDQNKIDDFLSRVANAYTDEDNDKIQLYVLATAGMRKVNEAEANALYSEISRRVSSNANYELKGAMTISGRYEGFCAWVAANFKNGKIAIGTSRELILKEADNPTYGILEIGGASMQIAFKADGNSADYISRNGLGSIYSKSYLGCGVNSVFDKYTGETESYNFTTLNINLNATKTLIPPTTIFWGLGGSIGAYFKENKTLENYIQYHKFDNFIDHTHHSYMNGLYIKYITECLGLNLSSTLKAPVNPSNWTEGAALDILLYGTPEAYNNN